MKGACTEALAIGRQNVESWERSVKSWGGNIKSWGEDVKSWGESKGGSGGITAQGKTSLIKILPLTKRMLQGQAPLQKKAALTKAAGESMVDTGPHEVSRLETW